MILAKVVGECVATRKHASHEGRKLLLVQPLDLNGQEHDQPLLALDAVDAGEGDTVVVVQEGFSAMTAVERPNAPIDAAVVGVLDHLTLNG